VRHRAMVNGLPWLLLLVPLVVAWGWRLGVSTGTASMPSYSMREAAILAERFWAVGYSFPDIQRHLRGPDSLQLISAIAAFAPRPDASDERQMKDLRLVA